jgi:thiol-disulfide isomerase/thioredoxin
MKIITTALLAASLVTAFFACSSPIDKRESSIIDEAIEPPKEVDRLPAFMMMDASGKRVDLRSFKGKKVFVNLWATWCPPCRAEMPSIMDLSNKVDKERAVFVMLSLDENFNVAKDFAKARDLDLPVYYPAEQIPELFQTEVIPATFIFDENGSLIKQNNGADDYSTPLYVDLLIK